MEELTKKEIEAFEGLDYSYAQMDRELKAVSPICHFTKMNYEFGDEIYDENWWECSHCGHTKSM